jgi:GTPase SAR1 family protein
LDSLERLASPTFKPTRDDILHARIKTTQVIVEKYEIENTMFELYDVGGQRSERRKWLDCFDDMDAVIFVAAISEYDQTLAESKKTNRMCESIEVFRSVCRNRSFQNTPMVLFLNKKDVYAEKIQYSDIAAQEPFKDYDGPAKDFAQGAKYFISQFEDCMNKGGRKDQYIHVTCATDTEQSKFCMRSLVSTCDGWIVDV